MSNPTLPPELLNMIIPASVPLPSRNTIPQRVDVLSSISLLSSTWTEFAKYHLDSHVHAKARVLRGLERQMTLDGDNSRLARKAAQARTLLVGKWLDHWGPGLPKLFSQFKSVDEVWMENTQSWPALTAVAVLPSEFSPSLALRSR